MNLRTAFMDTYPKCHRHNDWANLNELAICTVTHPPAIPADIFTAMSNPGDLGSNTRNRGNLPRRGNSQR